MGLAYNQNFGALTNTSYTIPRSYKTFQYLWLRKRWKKVSASFLFLSNGMQYIDTADATRNETRFSFTAGTHLKYKVGQFSMTGNAYYQFGRDVANNNLNAYLFGLEFSYKLPKIVTLGLGAEIQRGNDKAVVNGNRNNAFSPLYGTNHKFNGLMDYFYVGNHTNSVGLLDINATFGYQKNKFSATLVPHLFSSAATVIDNTNNEMSNELGTELDLILGYKWTKDINFNAGYSQMFATETMEVLKAGNKDNTNNWAWVMITIKPSLFTTTFDD